MTIQEQKNQQNNSYTLFQCLHDIILKILTDGFGHSKTMSQRNYINDLKVNFFTSLFYLIIAFFFQYLHYL